MVQMFDYIQYFGNQYTVKNCETIGNRIETANLCLQLFDKDHALHDTLEKLGLNIHTGFPDFVLLRNGIPHIVIECKRKSLGELKYQQILWLDFFLKHNVLAFIHLLDLKQLICWQSKDSRVPFPHNLETRIFDKKGESIPIHIKNKWDCFHKRGLPGRPRISNEMIHYILLLHEKEYSLRAIAKELGISAMTVCRYLHKEYKEKIPLLRREQNEKDSVHS